MAYYHTCPECGANLDPCEKCDCQTIKNNITKEANENVRSENHDCRPGSGGCDQQPCRGTC